MPSVILELPTEVDLERKIDEIDGRIQMLKDSIEDQRAEIHNTRLQGMHEARNPAVKQAVGELRAQIKMYVDQRAIHFAEYDRIRAEFYSLLDANRINKKKIFIRDYDELQQRIEDCKYYLAYTTLQPSEEKALVAEIDRLELSKPAVRDASERQKIINENKDRQAMKKAEIEMYS